ncbi:NAD(P)-dependent oxidoreductase [Actinophytocola sp.]|uniref:NAD-dependent epimerase/dehydratase family protein n=1 Tax=Actinophytocola sp. TaxID=1872138 RepID=UPI002ED5302F
MTAARVLLFGASGFVGHQVAEVLARDPRVGVLTRAGRGEVRDGWVRHDLVAAGPGELGWLLRHVRPDVVINCTGKLAGTTTELVEANVRVTARLLDAVQSEAPAARLVVLGSAGEYGTVPHGQPVAEDDPQQPVADYGVTKLASTQLVRAAAAAERVDAVALRVFNPIGPGLPVENLLGRAAERMRAAIARDEDAIRLGPLGAYRDFVDVRDVATAITAAALAGQVKEPVLNVGSGVAVKARDVVGMLAEEAGFTGRVLEAAPAPARSSAVDWIAADVSRIQRTLGWAPTLDLRESVRASWAA